MTGRYPSHTGIGPDVLVENVPYGMPAREKFVAEYLKDAGYKTHAIGKVSVLAPQIVCPPCVPALCDYLHVSSGIWASATTDIWQLTGVSTGVCTCAGPPWTPPQAAGRVGSKFADRLPILIVGAVCMWFEVAAIWATLTARMGTGTIPATTATPPVCLILLAKPRVSLIGSILC